MVSPFSEVYRKRRVLVTGHTGFKGTWLTLWLHRLGAQVTGLSLAPEKGGMFIAVGAKELCTSLRGDIRRYQTVADALAEVRPEVVFHLAAQSLVLRGYREPLETFATNALGTAHLLEALRRRNRPASVVVVSSDKCYAPSAAPRGYREGDPLGGDDPYAMSKAATELLVECYRASYFTEGTLRVASARAGNVIGGGDWASDRLVPDVIRALRNGAPITLRNPQAIRPWQHVLEPVGGYLRLGAHLLAGDERAYGPFNFGPRSERHGSHCGAGRTRAQGLGLKSPLEAHAPSRQRGCHLAPLPPEGEGAAWVHSHLGPRRSGAPYSRLVPADDKRTAQHPRRYRRL